MHYTKEFTKYSFQKKTQLIVFLIIKVAVLGVIFTGLFFLLKNYISPVLLFALLHMVLLACVLIFLFIHKHKDHNNHNQECNCEVK